MRPVLCLGPSGASMAMHEADVVLMSYEQLREQLHASAGSTSLLHQFGFWRWAAGRGAVEQLCGVAATLPAARSLPLLWLATHVLPTLRMQ